MSLIYSSPRNSALLAYKLKNHKIVRLAEGIYSDDVTTPIRKQIIAQLDDILIHLGIAGSYTYSSALGVEDNDDTVYISGDRNRKITLNGVVVIVLLESVKTNAHRTPAVKDSSLLRPSLYRAILENIDPLGVIARRRTNPEMAEKKLREHIGIVATNNPVGVQHEIAVFKLLATEMGLERVMPKIEEIANSVCANVAAKKSTYGAIDSVRLKMFSVAAERLSAIPEAEPLDITKFTNDQRNTLAFFESYFSNYIEGAEFEVDEAERIVFEAGYNDRAARSKDGHDVLALFNLINQPVVNMQTPDDYLNIIKRWNRELMMLRSERAGEFKVQFNRAGNTRFVAPELVDGTLRQSFAMAQDLPPGIARAAFLKLSFIEIHPFNDGNGRISRLLLNNELQRNNLSRLIVPTVFREDYILALKAFSQSGNIIPYERMLRRLIAINSAIPKDMEIGKLSGWLRDRSAFCNATESMWGLTPPSIETTPTIGAQIFPVG